MKKVNVKVKPIKYPLIEKALNKSVFSLILNCNDKIGFKVIKSIDLLNNWFKEEEKKLVEHLTGVSLLASDFLRSTIKGEVKRKVDEIITEERNRLSKAKLIRDAKKEAKKETSETQPGETEFKRSNKNNKDNKRSSSKDSDEDSDENSEAKVKVHRINKNDKEGFIVVDSKSVCDWMRVAYKKGEFGIKQYGENDESTLIRIINFEYDKIKQTVHLVIK